MVANSSTSVKADAATEYEHQHAEPGSKQSCLQCRARKVRCDRAAGCCGPCHRLSYACSFSRTPDVAESLSDKELTQAGTKRRRTRVACDHCRNVKAKCTGGRPCNRCQSRGYECATKQDGINCNTISPPPIHASAADRVTERECIQAYFDNTNAASCVFLHRPTVLSKWTQGKLDVTLLKALCAAGRRFREGIDDSSVQSWMSHVRSIIMAHLNKFSVSRLQALVLLIQFYLQTGDTAEAWSLMSLAARFAFTLRLNYERPELDPVTQESHRRLVWAIYLLDRLFASGIEDLSLCPLERLHIRLPCDDRSFERGMASRAEYPKQAPQEGDMDPLAYIIRLYECRENILKYTKRVRREGISPAASADKQSALQAALDEFEASLPNHLQQRPENLPVVAHSEYAHSFFLLRTLWLQCHCDLYRFFISGIRESVTRTITNNSPPAYVDFCLQRCLSSAIKLCEFWSDILQLWSGDLVEETLVDVSIYQVTQILHCLHHHLPSTGPHSAESLKSIIQRTLQVVSSSRNGVSRVSEGLRAAESLVQKLGQIHPETRRSSQDNIEHLPSHGSLIPETYRTDDFEVREQAPAHTSYATLDAMGKNASVNLGPLFQVSNVPAAEGDTLGLEELTNFLPWNPFGTEANDYYNPGPDGRGASLVL